MIDLITRSPLFSLSPIEILINLVIGAAFVLIVASVIIDFSKYHKQKRGVEDSANSLVETGSMTIFFITYYLSIKMNLLHVSANKLIGFAALIIGLILIVVGIVFNVYGRIVLKSNWANQIKIYKNHSLITSGPYKIVRHPLYASLIWIFLGGSLVYMNLVSFLLNLFVFVPMMTIRARKEDELLSKKFGIEYNKYKVKTGMFFPKIGVK